MTHRLINDCCQEMNLTCSFYFSLCSDLPICKDAEEANLAEDREIATCLRKTLNGAPTPCRKPCTEHVFDTTYWGTWIPNSSIVLTFAAGLCGTSQPAAYWAAQGLLDPAAVWPGGAGGAVGRLLSLHLSHQCTPRVPPHQSTRTPCIRTPCTRTPYTRHSFPDCTYISEIVYFGSGRVGKKKVPYLLKKVYI